VKGQHDAEDFARQGGTPVIERRTAVPGFDADARIEPIAMAGEFPSYPEVCGVFDFPGIVTDQTGQEIDAAKQNQQPTMQRLGLSLKHDQFKLKSKKGSQGCLFCLPHEPDTTGHQAAFLLYF